MRRFTLVPAALLALAFASCQVDNDRLASPLPDPKVALTSTQLDEHIFSTLRQRGEFDWNAAPAHTIWSALEQSDHVLSVGYQPTGGQAGAPLPDDARQLPAWQQAREQVLALILAEEQKANPDLTADKLRVFEANSLPVLTVTVRQLRTIQALRASGLVRYAEPMGYEPNGQRPVAGMTPEAGPANRSGLLSSGCGNNTATAGLTAGPDYTVLSGGAKSSWNQQDQYHGIRAAWSQSTGQGQKILIIDTGASGEQENLGSAFNQGQSTGRTVERLVTYPRATIFGIPYGDTETPDDACGHGTSMAGAAAAPRGTDGAAVGVAYNANLIVVRAATDVFLDASREVQGVTDAYLLAANRADVRIISMSMGRLTSSGQMRDAIRYASDKGKLIFCAAGTSFDWSAGWVGVIYPASLPEAVAVTGMKDDLKTRCDECHTGAAVEFTVVMQRTANDRRPLTLAMSGDAPSTVGGSSVATASMAGMAAVVWARYPTETRTQILARLVAASSNRSRRDTSFGWGRVNVATAVGAPAL